MTATPGDAIGPTPETPGLASGLPGSVRRRLGEGRTWLRRGPAGLAALAIVTGFGAGLGAIAFRALIAGATSLFIGGSAFGVLTRPVSPTLPALGVWFIVAVPAIGGLIYGPLIERFAPEARGHGVPEVMLAVSAEGGRIRPRVALIKSVASAVCLGAGGSVGREGPIVQIGSALGSSVGQVLHLGEEDLRMLVACGAAGGISATFNAPIAGVFFALELILRDFGVRSFGAVVLASVTAAVVGRAAWGSAAFLTLPPFQIVSAWDYGLYAVLGLAAAVVGVAFIRTLYGTEDFIDRLWGRRPAWLRPVVGGLALGLLLLALPQLYGVGYGPLEQAIEGKTALDLLVLLLVGKLVATSLTIGIGGSGGVFAPSLFLGGMLGAAFGMIVNTIAPGAVAPPGAFGLVGMGAVFASAARAPITAVLILFELTGDYQIILPMMLAIAVSAGVSALVSPDTIYTLKLRRRGIDVTRDRTASPMTFLTIGDAMRRSPGTISAERPVGEIVERVAAEPGGGLPVVDADDRYLGVLTAARVEETLRNGALDTTVGDLVADRPAMRPAEPLERAVEALVTHGVEGLAVVEPVTDRIVGWLSHRDILAAYAASRNAAPRSRRAAASGSLPEAPSPPPDASMPPQGALSWWRHYRILDLELGPESGLVGRRLGDLPWPALSLPVSVARHGQRFVPSAGTVIASGDELSVLVPSGQTGELMRRFGQAGDASPSHPSGPRRSRDQATTGLRLKHGSHGDYLELQLARRDSDEVGPARPSPGASQPRAEA